MDGPRDKVEGSVVDYLVLPLPFPLSVPLPSVRGESGGLAPGFFFPWVLHGSTKVRCPGGRPSVSEN